MNPQLAFRLVKIAFPGLLFASGFALAQQYPLIDMLAGKVVDKVNGFELRAAVGRARQAEVAARAGTGAVVAQRSRCAQGIHQPHRSASGEQDVRVRDDPVTAVARINRRTR